MAAIIDRSRAVERIARICESSTADAVGVRLAVLDEIRQVIDFDSFAWLLTDPETEVGSAPLADVPRLSELPRLIRLKYLTPVNRWTGMETPVALLAASTRGHLDHSLVWREMLSQFGVIDVASLVIAADTAAGGSSISGGAPEIPRSPVGTRISWPRLPSR